MVPRENLDQRRLARAVLAQQAVNLSPLEGDAGGVQRECPAEALGEVPRRER